MNRTRAFRCVTCGSVNSKPYELMIVAEVGAEHMHGRRSQTECGLPCRICDSFSYRARRWRYYVGSRRSSTLRCAPNPLRCLPRYDNVHAAVMKTTAWRLPGMTRLCAVRARHRIEGSAAGVGDIHLRAGGHARDTARARTAPLQGNTHLADHDARSTAPRCGGEPGDARAGPAHAGRPGVAYMAVLLQAAASHLALQQCAYVSARQTCRAAKCSTLRYSW